MEITVTDKLKSYLMDKNEKNITLNLPMRKFCCAGPYLPAVRLGKPKKTDEFSLVEIDDVTVYINKKIRYSKPKLNISLRQFMLMKEVYVFDPDTVCICSGGDKNT